MIISNLRKEERGNRAYIITDFECSFSEQKQLWFSVPLDMSYSLADDVYDAFLVAALYPAMFYKENIVIKGNVTHNIYYNMLHYVQDVVLTFFPMNRIEISVDGFCNCKPADNTFVATGYSGGVDSFATLVDHFDKETDGYYRISKLLFFNVGQFGNIKNPLSQVRAINRYNYCCEAANFMGLPLVLLETNLFDYYKPEWEYYAGALCRATCVLVIQKGCRIFYISSDISYKQQIRSAEGLGDESPILQPLLSTPNCSIILDGAQYTRVEKTKMVSTYAPVRKFMNVCVDSSDKHLEHNNCSKCHKCKRTMMTLDLLGLKEEFSGVFNFKEWHKLKYPYMCSLVVGCKQHPYSKEIVELAKSKNARVPSFLEAFIMDVFFRGVAKIKRSFK